MKLGEMDIRHFFLSTSYIDYKQQKNLNQFVTGWIYGSVPVNFSLFATTFCGPCWPKNEMTQVFTPSQRFKRQAGCDALRKAPFDCTCGTNIDWWAPLLTKTYKLGNISKDSQKAGKLRLCDRWGDSLDKNSCNRKKERRRKILCSRSERDFDQALERRGTPITRKLHLKLLISWKKEKWRNFITLSQIQLCAFACFH